jgi:pimeloyl-ACP methyl ester carboxylesterase
MQNFEWVNRELFPFQSRFMEIEGHQLHYVDEGVGPVIIFSHGTPEWSFGWRDLIKPLSAHFRCIAPDLLGMGLSDKPQDADYRVEAHATRFARFIKKLDLQVPFNIIGNDFGLAIAMSYAINHPDQVAQISLFNGWMWRLDTDPHYGAAVKLYQGAFGRFLYKKLNFPVNFIMPMAFGNRKKYLTKEIHRHYKMALPNAASRAAAYEFVQELSKAGPWWQSLWEKRDLLQTKPLLIFWGMKDIFVPKYELDKWIDAFPNARVIRCEEAGHFVQEEATELMISSLLDFFQKGKV